MSLPVWRSRVRDVVLILLITVIYYIAGKLGLRLAFLHASATPVWPPTGIALAAMLLLGPRVWPGIFLGAFFINITTAGTVATSIGIALGNTLEGLIGARLVNQIANSRKAFDRPHDVFKFTLAALIATTVSATFGVASLTLAGYSAREYFGAIWFTWWLGDVGGALIVTPFLILLFSSTARRWEVKKFVESLLALSALVVTGLAVYGGWLPASIKHYPLEFLTIPILIWVAFRFNQRVTAFFSLILSGVAIWGTLSGYGPFAVTAKNESLLLIQVFMGISAMSAMLLAAAVAERTRIKETLETSENRFRAVIEHSLDAIALINSEGKIIYSSPSTLNVLGYTPAEFTGINGFEFIHPEDREYAMNVLAKTVQNPQQLTSMQVRVRHKNGSWRWVETLGNNLLSNPSVGAIVVNYRDITDRRLAEEKLKSHTKTLEVANEMIEQEKAQDEALLASIGDGVIVTDKTGVITFFNRQAEKLLGLKSIDVMGKQLFDMVIAENETAKLLPREERPFQIALTKGRSVTTNQYYLRRDKSRFPVSVTAAPVVLNESRVGAIDVFRDITREEEVDRMITEFIALAAHQLRTPLSNMRWNMELLLQKSKVTLSPEVSVKFERILSNTKQIIIQVSELISASQILQGKVIDHPESVDLPAVVTHEIAEIEAAAKQKGVTISYTSGESLISPLFIDPNRLHDVVENLLSNALKFNHPNGQISLSLKQIDKHVHFTVADTGIGSPV